MRSSPLDAGFLAGMVLQGSTWRHAVPQRLYIRNIAAQSWLSVAGARMNLEEGVVAVGFARQHRLHLTALGFGEEVPQLRIGFGGDPASPSASASSIRPGPARPFQGAGRLDLDANAGVRASPIERAAGRPRDRDPPRAH
jgi:hypothetical protein